MGILIKNTELPSFLGIIGEALANGKDLEIYETPGGYLYTKIPGKESKVLRQPDPPITINPQEDLSFTPQEIDEMEKTFHCLVLGEEVDLYYCRHLCHDCNDKR